LKILFRHNQEFQRESIISHKYPLDVINGSSPHSIKFYDIPGDAR